MCCFHWPIRNWRWQVYGRCCDEFPVSCRHYANTTALCPRRYDISGIAMVKKAIFSYAWKHISMSNVAEPFHDYSIILEKTCCLSFCLNGVEIKTLSIFCCFCTLFNLCLKYSVLFVFLLFARSRDLEMPGNISAVYVNITRRICQRAMSLETNDRPVHNLYTVIAFSVSLVRCLN